jgi:hypothetical protein
VPPGSVDVVNEKRPPASVPRVRLVPLATTVTAPVGAAPATVTVKVTDWKNVLELLLDVMVVVVAVCAWAAAVANSRKTPTADMRLATCVAMPRNATRKIATPNLVITRAGYVPHYACTIQRGGRYVSLMTLKRYFGTDLVYEDHPLHFGHAG